MLRFVVLAALAACLTEAMPGAGYGGAGYGGAGNRGAGYGGAGYGGNAYNAGYGTGHGTGYGYGKAASHNGYEADVNKNNAARQLGVNTNAQYVGSGTGTARLDGVPGTPLGRTGYGYGHNAGYGNNAGYNAGYGNNAGYNAGYANNAGYGGHAVGYANNRAVAHGNKGYGAY